LAAKHVLLLMDFDKTLAPIVNDPTDARILPRIRNLLTQLNRHARITVAVISGRALQDLRLRVGLHLIYAGNHGLEMSAPYLQYRNETAVLAATDLAELARRATGALSCIHGAIVENKGLTVSVHFRQVPEGQWPDVVGAVKQEVERVANLFDLSLGKKVLEIKPKTGWNKGSAAQMLRGHLDLGAAFPIAIGDDATDEDLFNAFDDGVSIKVGCSKSSKAMYELTDCEEVAEFLEHLLRISRVDDERLGPKVMLLS